MKPEKSKKPTTKLGRDVAKALRRAAARARKEARMHGAMIHVMSNGKIVALRP